MLLDMQDKQNIDIGLIMGRGTTQGPLAPDRMPALPRANVMHMGYARSISASKHLPRVLLYNWPNTCFVKSTPGVTHISGVHPTNHTSLLSTPVCLQQPGKTLHIKQTVSGSMYDLSAVPLEVQRNCNKMLLQAYSGLRSPAGLVWQISPTRSCSAMVQLTRSGRSHPLCSTEQRTPAQHPLQQNWDS